MARRRNATVSVTDTMTLASGEEVDVEIDCEVSAYDPGRSYGPPENCYPPEGGEVESFEVYEIRGKKRIRRRDLDDAVDEDWLNDRATSQLCDAWDDGEAERAYQRGL